MMRSRTLGSRVSPGNVANNVAVFLTTSSTYSTRYIPHETSVQFQVRHSLLSPQTQHLDQVECPQVGGAPSSSSRLLFKNSKFIFKISESMTHSTINLKLIVIGGTRKSDECLLMRVL